ncbi:MAG: superinfection immunity protein [Betaproteobacteria bacterium]|nr:superinfection immunity protein [Betaproteobacteria bacterium]
MLAAGLAVYFIPSIIARSRRHHNFVAIFLLNFFFGWSLIGWVVSLVWAFTSPPPPQQIVVNVRSDGPHEKSS